MIAVLVALAAAAPTDPLDRMLASREAVLAALAPTVTVGAVAWRDPACGELGATVTGAARGKLADCVAALHLTRAKLQLPGTAAIGTSGAVVAIALRAGKLVGLGPVAPGKDALPTVLRWWVNRDFAPSDRTKQALRGRAELIVKLCHDDSGAVTSRRILHGSGVAAFDAEALAYFAGLDHVEPYQPGGVPAAACSVLAFRYPDILGGGATP